VKIPEVLHYRYAQVAASGQSLLCAASPQIAEPRPISRSKPVVPLEFYGVGLAGNTEGDPFQTVVTVGFNDC